MPKEDLKVLLIFPPVWLPEAPYLSTPILKAYLQERGINVIQQDLNIEFWTHFYDETEIRDIYRRLAAKWNDFRERTDLNEYDMELQENIACVIGLDEDRFVYEVKNEIIEKALYRKLVQGVSAFHVDDSRKEELYADVKEEVQNYHDLLYSDISFSIYSYSKKDLSSILKNKSKNPYYAYYKKHVIRSIVDINPDILGISIVAINQIIPAFTLAKVIKEELPDTHFVIGGPWCTQIRERLGPYLNQFDCIDSMIVYEGEEALFQLCHCIRDKKDLKDVPNIYFKSDGHVIESKNRSEIDMDELPTPDFDNLPLERYDDQNTLPIQASRGCYWGKCTFCSYPVIEPEYKIRGVIEIVNDIESLIKKYKKDTYCFADALLSPTYIKMFADSIKNKKLKINWISYSRLEKSFTNKELLLLAKESGCIRLNWGIESGSKKILKTIKKNIDFKSAKIILKNSYDAGIHNRVLVMFGFPSELIDDALLTIKFLNENISNISSVAPSYFYPEINTPIVKEMNGFLMLIDTIKRNDLALGYTRKHNLNEKELNIIKQIYENIYIQFVDQNSESMVLREYDKNKIFTNEDNENGANTIIKVNNRHGIKTIIAESGKRKYYKIEYH